MLIFVEKTRRDTSSLGEPRRRSGLPSLDERVGARVAPTFAAAAVPEAHISAGGVAYRPGGVFVFDNVSDGDVEGMNERVAACYAWAVERRLVVIDEVISWLPQFEPDYDQALRRVAGQCRCHRAALVVHSVAVVSRAGQLVPELAGVPVWSVDARLPFA